MKERDIYWSLFTTLADVDEVVIGTGFVSMFRSRRDQLHRGVEEQSWVVDAFRDVAHVTEGMQRELYEQNEEWINSDLLRYAGCVNREQRRLHEDDFRDEFRSMDGWMQEKENRNVRRAAALVQEVRDRLRMDRNLLSRHCELKSMNAEVCSATLEVQKFGEHCDVHVIVRTSSYVAFKNAMSSMVYNMRRLHVMYCGNSHSGNTFTTSSIAEG